MVPMPPANQRIRNLPIRNHTHTKTARVTAGKSCVIPNICKWHHKLITGFKLMGLLKLRGE